MNSILMTTGNGQKVYDLVKTQTRRLTGLEYPNSEPGAFELVKQQDGKFFFSRSGALVGGVVTCPYRVGERRYIREPHYLYGRWKRDGKTKTGKAKYRFIADRSMGACYPNNPPPRVCTRKSAVGWFRRPGMFMFEWAARTIVEITEVRIQRVQEITVGDCIREGIPEPRRTGEKLMMVDDGFDTIWSFRALWDSIHGAGAWERNPWVWAVTMRRVPQ